MSAYVYLTLISRVAADNIALSFIQLGYAVAPTWNIDGVGDTICIEKENSVAALMGICVSQSNAPITTGKVYEDLANILEHKKIDVYSIIVQDCDDPEDMIGSVGNIQFSKANTKKENGKILPFPHKLEKPADGIIEDNEVPPTNN